MHGQATDERLYDPADWSFDPDAGIWRGPNDEQFSCCERCGAFPFVTLIITSTGPYGEPNVAYGTLCRRDAEIFPNFPEGAWLRTWE